MYKHAVISKPTYLAPKFLLCLTFLTLPIYYFPSGGVQFSDFAIITLFLYLVFFETRFLLRFPKKFIYPFLPFIFWSATIGLTYQAFDNSTLVYTKNSLYVAYGFFLLFIFTVVFAKLNLSENRLLFLLLLVSFAYPLLMSDINFSGRNTLSFNNPNQLGYFAVCIISFILIYLSFIRNLNLSLTSTDIIWVALIAILSNFLSYLSASRASLLSIIIANGLIGYFILASSNVKKRIFIILLSLFVILNIFVFILFNNTRVDESQLYDGTFARLKSKKLFDFSDFKKRTLGFFKFDDITAILIGSGGKIEDHLDFEVHNTALNILKNYGLIGGLLLFGAALIYLLILRPNLVSILCLMPIFIYNMTHYGFRFRAFWLSIGFFTSVSIILKYNNAGSQN